MHSVIESSAIVKGSWMVTDKDFSDYSYSSSRIWPQGLNLYQTVVIVIDVKHILIKWVFVIEYCIT